MIILDQNLITEQFIKAAWSDHIFFYITRMARCVCVITWRTHGTQDALWVEGNVLDITETPMHTLSLGYSLKAVLFQQDNAPSHKARIVQERFEEHNNVSEVLTLPSEFPRSQSNRASVGCAGQTSLIHGGSNS